jgi:hypothetical protein
MKTLAAIALLSAPGVAAAAPPGDTPPSLPRASPGSTRPEPSPGTPTDRAPTIPTALPRPVPSAAAPATPPQTSDTGAIFSQIAIGAALGVGGLFGGAYLGYKLDCGSSCGGDFAGFRGLVVGAALGLTIATTAGVAIIGSDDEHDPSIGLTWLGTVIGGSLGLLGAIRLSGDSPAASTLVLATSTAMGGALMFHVTRTRKRPKAVLRMVPVTADRAVGLSLVASTP